MKKILLTSIFALFFINVQCCKHTFMDSAVFMSNTSTMTSLNFEFRKNSKRTYLNFSLPSLNTIYQSTWQGLNNDNTFVSVHFIFKF